MGLPQGLRVATDRDGGFAVACAAIEGLSRTLASKVGQHGVRDRGGAHPRNGAASPADAE
jgi:hypothetical protein